jgi:hypothetical protein
MKRIAAACVFFALVGCGLSPEREVLLNEYKAYESHIHAEVSAGRITPQHGEYLLSQKVSEIVNRAQQGQRPNVTYTPVRRLPTPRQTNCTTTAIAGVLQTYCN